MGIDEEHLLSVLGAWLPDRRWFGGKGHRITRLRVVSRTSVCHGGEHLVLGVEIDGRSSQIYQVPVFFEGRSGAGVIAEVEGGYLHDGLARVEVVTSLLTVGGPAVLNPAEPASDHWRSGGGTPACSERAAFWTWNRATRRSSSTIPYW